MENELSLSNADLGMNVLNVLAELDKRIQEKERNRYLQQGMEWR